MTYFTMAEKNKLKEAISTFKNKVVLVLGDVMLDQYSLGEVSRISPEAPIPIFKNMGVNSVPGGAANVALNLASLGASVILSGVVGNDDRKEKLINILKKAKIDVGGVIIDNSRPTTLKHRFIANNHQLLRFDDETVEHLHSAKENKIISFVNKNIAKVDIVILSDYAKGVFSKKLTQAVIKIAKRNKKKIIADIKPRNKDYFSGVDILVPNLKEAREITGLNNVLHIGPALKKHFRSDIVLKRGSDGITVWKKNENKPKHLRARKVKVFDVSGAGDTVIATLALGLASGLDLKSSAILGNHAGGIVVQKPGTATISIDELEGVLRTGNHIEKVEIVAKVWGYEKWLENNPKYCCKILSLNKGYQCSLHYHKEKDEMFLVTKGQVKLELAKEVTYLRKGNFIRIPPGTVHRFYGVEDSEILEVSTHHKEEDSYRLEESKRVS